MRSKVVDPGRSGGRADPPLPHDLDRLLRRVSMRDRVTQRAQLLHLLAGVSTVLAAGPSRGGEAVAALPGSDRGHGDLEQIGDRRDLQRLAIAELWLST